jgi:hypothetical protein
MQLLLTEQDLRIDLDLWERIWAVYFNADLVIPLAHITQVSTQPPTSDWRDVRLPGTFVPGVIKAGTYYTPRGKEFWYVTRGDSYLTLELNNEFYQKIVLTLGESQRWAERIDQRRQT